MASKRSRSRKEGEALALLKADHDKVKKLFRQFEKMHEDGEEDEAQQLAQQTCNELKIHTLIEEEIFYPEVRDAIDDNDLMEEAEIEHASAKQLIEQIEAMDGSDEKFAATVTVLGEYVNHHIKEEQNEMFRKARKARLEQQELAQRMMERKQEMMSELGMSEGEQDTEDSEPLSRRSARRSRTSSSRVQARR